MFLFSQKLTFFLHWEIFLWKKQEDFFQAYFIETKCYGVLIEFEPSTFTFSGKKILHLQKNMHLQEILAFASKSCSWLIETAMHSSKKMLHLQEKSCLYKKILRLQENLAKAKNLCICNKILQKQEYLSTKCKGAQVACIAGECFTTELSVIPCNWPCSWLQLPMNK